MKQLFECKTIQVFAKKSRSGAINRSAHAVLGGSLLQDSFEESFWNIPSKGEPDQVLDAVRSYSRESRKRIAAYKRDMKEGLIDERVQRPHHVQTSTVEVLDYLCMLARTCKGKIFPTYDNIMDKVGRSRQTVAKAIKQLIVIGVLEKKRRYRLDDITAEGKVYKQTSNAYRIRLPKVLYKYLPKSKQPAPLPLDEEQRIAEAAISMVDMLKQDRKTPVIEALPDQWQDDVLSVEHKGLRDALASLGNLLNLGESNKKTQTPSNSNIL